MWLKQMVIDGFKSYAQRTVISDWDRHFTAITGLNGSGKSNILDAICFVLGITNLSQVRVENLQQLVYKEGQARVTKASVSLVFDNRDPTDSPIGYEDYDEITVTRQVVIGGRNKYMINGQTAQLNRIRDLFHSVQLDVNNPHFLIMQGRITKVLNMKPHEILGMIQEAAGTKMYELKKSQALKTMNKKQVKVNEINEILEEEITPQLEKLRREKTHYLQWTKNNQEIDKLDRLMVVYKYMTHKERIDNGTEELNELKEQAHETRAQMEFLADDIEKTKNDIAVKQDQKARDEQGIVLELSKKLNEENKKLKSLEQQFKNERDNIKRERKELQQINKIRSNAETLMKEKEAEYIACDSKYKEVNERYNYLRERIESLQSQQLGIGMDEKGDSGSLAQQLMDAKRLKSEYKSQLTTTKNKIKNVKKELTKLNQKIKTHQNMNSRLEDEYKHKEKVIEALKEELITDEDQDIDMKDNNNDDDEKMIESINYEEEIAKKQQRLYQLRNDLTRLQNDASRFNFEYSDPYRNFDRRSVFGKVGSLLSVKQSEYCRAIEICAGGRLYNVVVDNNETAKSILKGGRLKKRVTIIPLNKIASATINESIVRRAKDLVGSEHVHLALNLIGYEADLENAMKYVFGSAFICSDMNSAKQVAFTKGIQCKSVTLDGEVFNPSGLLTGGSSYNRASILESIQRFKRTQDEYSRLQFEVQELEVQLNDKNARDRRENEIRNKIEILSHELQVIQQRMADSAYGTIQNRISEMEKELNVEENENLKDIEMKLKSTEEKCRDLSSDLNNYEQRRTDQKKHVKKQMSECKKEIKNLKKDLKETTEDKNRISQEINDLKEELSSTQTNEENCSKLIAEFESKCCEIETQITQIEGNRASTESELNIQRQKLTEQDSELKKLAKVVTKNEKQHSLMDINCSKLTSELSKLTEDMKHSRKTVSRLVSEYDWLSGEESTSSTTRAMYEQIRSNNFESIKKRSAKLKDEQSTLSNRINHKVMSMFERAENEYRDLIKKREIIRNDKKKIESVIRELDKKKEDTLETTYKKVNEHFGNIFSKLLPGTKCKLDKIKKNDDDDEESASILDGLEVKVAFSVINNDRNNNSNNNANVIWKESLSELSGGQRSLLALSLILSLLLFKPAPLYILDEIDAALDLSHTQNIGILISKYFAKSQFIVVSLKEGMFTNANVIFRTSFIDGVSAVKRTVGSGLKHNNNNKENDSNHNRNRLRK